MMAGVFREQCPAADCAHMVRTKGPLHQQRFDHASTPTSVTRGGSSQTHVQASCRHPYLQDCLDRLAAAEAGADIVSTLKQQPQCDFEPCPSLAQPHGQLSCSVVCVMDMCACESESESQGDSENGSDNLSGCSRGSINSAGVSVRGSGVVRRGEIVNGEEREGREVQQTLHIASHCNCSCGDVRIVAATRMGSVQPPAPVPPAATAATAAAAAAAAAPGVAQTAMAAIAAFLEPVGLVGLLNSPAVAAAAAAMNLAAALQFQQLPQKAPHDVAVHRTQSCSTVSNTEIVSRARRLTRQQQWAEQARRARKQQERLLRQQRQRLLRLQQARRAAEVVAANTAVGAAAIAQVLMDQHPAPAGAAAPAAPVWPALAARGAAQHVLHAQQIEPHWRAGVAGTYQPAQAVVQPIEQPVLSPACSTNSSS